MTLFIGGCLDGKRIALKPGTTSHEGSAWTNGHDIRVDVSLDIQTDYYRPMPFAVDSYVTEVFVLHGTTPAEVLRRLIEGYRRSA